MWQDATVEILRFDQDDSFGAVVIEQPTFNIVMWGTRGHRAYSGWATMRK